MYIRNLLGTAEKSRRKFANSSCVLNAVLDAFKIFFYATTLLCAQKKWTTNCW